MNEWGAEKVTEKAAKQTSQGALFSYVHHNKKIASLIEIQCETDFVAGNNEFQQMGMEMAMQLASMPATKPEDFLKQEYIRDAKKKVSDLLKEAVLKFGENIKISRIIRWKLGE